MTTVRPPRQLQPIVGFSTPPLRTWTPDGVFAAEDSIKAFADYAQQTLGVPYPTIRDMTILRRKLKDFFALYPHCDIRTMCRVVVHMRSRKRRVPRVWMIVDEFRKAWAAGALPELDPSHSLDENIVERIDEALVAEHDPVWRRRLMLAQSDASRREVYLQWQANTMAR